MKFSYPNPKVYIYALHAVGMRFCRGREHLQVDKPFVSEREPTNPKDKNAIVIKDRQTKEKMGHIKRKEAEWINDQHWVIFIYPPKILNL